MNSDHFEAEYELSRLDAEIRLISRFRAIRLCRAALSLLLILLELLLTFLGRSSSSALNILLFANLMPWLLEELLASQQAAKKRVRFHNCEKQAPRIRQTGSLPDWFLEDAGLKAAKREVQGGVSEAPSEAADAGLKVVQRDAAGSALKTAETTAAEQTALPYLRKHWRYSPLRFTAESISYFLTCLLLILWQLCGSLPEDRLRRAPAAILAAVVLLRLAAPCYLAWRSRRGLMYGEIK